MAIVPELHELELAEYDAQYNNWSERWCQPVVYAIYTHKFDEALQALISARCELPGSGLPADVQEALGLYLDYLARHRRWHGDVDGWTRDDFDEALAYFSQPAQSIYADYHRARITLNIRLHADADGLAPLSKQEIIELLSQLEIKPNDGLVWFPVSTWAFHHNDLELLGRAFEVHLLHPSTRMGQAKWQRVNLMYHLVAGKATRRDIEEYIRNLEIKPQLVEFREHIWPRCIEAGLVDSGLSEMFELRASIVRKSEAEPRRERRTKSIRNRP